MRALEAVWLLSIEMRAPGLLPHLLQALRTLLSYHFMQNAFLAGTLIALVAGPIGYVMVLRGQSFAGHALSEIGFAGAAGAVLVGVSPIVGLLVFGSLGAVGIWALDARVQQHSLSSDVVVGTVLAFSLGLGLLFIALTAGNASNAYAFLFGTILGVSDRDLSAITLTSLVSLLILAAIARPLVYASLDPLTARARGVPVRLLSLLFLLLLALAVAEAVQVVGVLLIFALLVAPAAVAHELTARPAVSVALAIVLGLLFTWVGLAVAYFTAEPVGFFITTAAFGTYALVRLGKAGQRAVGRRLGVALRSGVL